MLQGLEHPLRERLEVYCEDQAVETAQFCGLYPEIINKELIRTLQVEARLRAATG